VTGNRSPITPETRVGEFLDAFPELEGVLLGLAPAFEKLKNPILRRTVAKVATLQQAARIGGLDVRDLVGRLRQAAGQTTIDTTDLEDADAVTASGLFETTAPGWFDDNRVEPPIDADAVLASGEHPLGQVRRRLAALEPGRILALTSGFRPVPLIDTLLREGYEVFVRETAGGQVTTYFCRATGSPTRCRP
jgi:hypothetical protein